MHNHNITSEKTSIGEVVLPCSKQSVERHESNLFFFATPFLFFSVEKVHAMPVPIHFPPFPFTFKDHTSIYVTQNLREGEYGMFEGYVTYPSYDDFFFSQKESRRERERENKIKYCRVRLDKHFFPLLIGIFYDLTGAVLLPASDGSGTCYDEWDGEKKKELGSKRLSFS